MFFLGIDFGTSGVRATIINNQKKEIYSCKTDIPKPLLNGGTVTQDPNIWWNAFINICRNLKNNFNINTISKISVNGTSGTVMLTNNDGIPLHDAIMYNDTSAIEESELVEKVSSNHPIVSSQGNALVRVLKLIKILKNIKSFKILHQADWIVGKITNNYSISDENNSLKLGYDCINKTWPDWISNLPIEIKNFPIIYTPGEFVNNLNNKELIDIGFKKSTKVIAGTTDSIAAFVATGANEIGQAVTSIGSTLVVKYIGEKPIFNKEYGIYSHKLGNNWLAGGASNVGGTILSKLFNGDIESLSSKINPYKLTGLKYYPLSKNGERFPYNDPNKQPILEPKPEKRIDFFQAVLEGITYVEKLSYERLNEIGGGYPSEVFTVGGGSNNENWNKIRSKILNLNLVKPLSSEASFGSALIAGGFLKK
tara:strand:+ start:1270 stop:2541 length:1272 start_codon:yes stop_codon:yes gene_type:complete